LVAAKNKKPSFSSAPKSFLFVVVKLISMLKKIRLQQKKHELSFSLAQISEPS
jgi:hypothetical protein